MKFKMFSILCCSKHELKEMSDKMHEIVLIGFVYCFHISSQNHHQLQLL